MRDFSVNHWTNKHFRWTRFTFELCSHTGFRDCKSLTFNISQLIFLSFEVATLFNVLATVVVFRRKYVNRNLPGQFRVATQSGFASRSQHLDVSDFLQLLWPPSICRNRTKTGSKNSNGHWTDWHTHGHNIKRQPRISTWTPRFKMWTDRVQYVFVS